MPNDDMEVRVERRSRVARRTASGVLVLFALCAAIAGARADVPVAAGDGARPDGPVDFEKHVAPLLIARCLGCHNSSTRKGDLDLSSRGTSLEGGDSGEVILPGKPGESYLVERVTEGEMPPRGKGKRLSESEVALLAAWIREGAPWPSQRVLSEFEVTTDKRAGFDWWSLRPVARPSVPEVAEQPVSSEIDAFIRRRLREKGLEPSPRAGRTTLLRRVYYDLIGLPPTPEETETFLADTAPDAYARLVDRLLASPRYGERWGRHWLDVAHYADTHGFERDKKRENAWPYRDYVIAAFNADKPYDEFLREQIAGDRIGPDDPDAVVATGFLAAGPYDFVGQEETKSPVLNRMARADDLDDMVTTVMTATVGLTVNCARCHDHKFDPVSQRDYYRLWAVFAGVKRGDRGIDPRWEKERPKKLAALRSRLREVSAELLGIDGTALDLADIVSGGSGAGDGKRGRGIDPRSGKVTTGKVGGLDDIQANRWTPCELEVVDGVLVPDGGPDGKAPIQVSSTGITVTGLSDTSAASWDYIKSGPVNAQHSTELDGVDYASSEHTMLSLHASKLITFDLAVIRRETKHDGALRFHSVAGYGGAAAAGGNRADFSIYVDGQLRMRETAVTRERGGIDVDIPIAAGERFLTLVTTDGGNGIGHDQVFFGDPKLAAVRDASGELSAAERERRAERLREKERLKAAIEALPPVRKVYAALPQKAPQVHILTRGDTESPAERVPPGSLACVEGLSPDLGDLDTPEAARRLALARWITDPRNPLTARVIVNRIWHYHFGAGIVATPSDFGFYGARPSHPELLDWLADELRESGWSIKSLHRRIVLSGTYQQSSAWRTGAAAIDGDNRFLWRMNPRRLEAEATRDAVLAVGGNLSLRMGGPGYQDFEYTERYAPIYRYITADRPALWRRTVYRFTVRSVPDRFMKVLDCPNPSNLTPVRSRTTTSLQSLALLNNGFMIQQARLFARRVAEEAGTDPEAQVERAFHLAFARRPDPGELALGADLVAREGLFQLCRMILNASEFVYVD